MLPRGSVTRCFKDGPNDASNNYKWHTTHFYRCVLITAYYTSNQGFSHESKPAMIFVNGQ